MWQFEWWWWRCDDRKTTENSNRNKAYWPRTIYRIHTDVNAVIVVRHHSNSIHFETSLHARSRVVENFYLFLLNFLNSFVVVVVVASLLSSPVHLPQLHILLCRSVECRVDDYCYFSKSNGISAFFLLLLDFVFSFRYTKCVRNVS